MKYILDIILIVAIAILIKAVYTVGDIFISTLPSERSMATETAYYKCGKNKKTDLYCPIIIKGD